MRWRLREEFREWFISFASSNKIDSSRAGVDLRSLLILPVRVSQPTVYSMLMAQALHKLHSLILIHCFCTLECRSFADGGFMFVHRGMFASFMLEPL